MRIAVRFQTVIGWAFAERVACTWSEAGGRGAAFDAGVPLDGHLDGGLYLWLAQCVRPNSELFIVLRLAPGLQGGLPEPRVALHGRVSRVTPPSGGGRDLRVTILDFQHL